MEGRKREKNERKKDVETTRRGTGRTKNPTTVENNLRTWRVVCRVESVERGDDEWERGEREEGRRDGEPSTREE